MKIAVDIDNTLCTTTRALCSQFNAYTGENLKLEDIKAYRIEDWVKPQYKSLIPALFHDANMWKRVEPLSHCRAVLLKLVEEGHEIYYATSTTTNNLCKKKAWCQRNFPFIDAEKAMIGIKHKQLLNVDILIDDCSDYLLGGTYKGILLDYPWNRDFECDAKTNFRAHDWYDVLNAVCRIKENEYEK